MPACQPQCREGLHRLHDRGPRLSRQRPMQARPREQRVPESAAPRNGMVLATIQRASAHLLLAWPIGTLGAPANPPGPLLLPLRGASRGPSPTCVLALLYWARLRLVVPLRAPSLRQWRTAAGRIGGPPLARRRHQPLGAGGTAGRRATREPPQSPPGLCHRRRGVGGAERTEHRRPRRSGVVTISARSRAEWRMRARTARSARQGRCPRAHRPPARTPGSASTSRTSSKRLLPPRRLVPGNRASSEASWRAHLLRMRRPPTRQTGLATAGNHRPGSRLPRPPP